MTRPAEARALCLTVCAHYRLSEEATALALLNAEAMPGRARECYAAVLASLTVERQMYGEASAVAARDAVNV